MNEIFLLAHATTTWFVCKGDEATLITFMSDCLKCALHTMAKQAIQREHDDSVRVLLVFAALGFLL